MNKEEFKKLLADVLTEEPDVGALSQAFETAITEFSALTDSNASLHEQIIKLEEKNQSLFKANGELFLKVGMSEAAPTPPDDDERPASIEDVLEELLDERGKF